ncbi:TRAUB-domain-containing protein [Zopfia rhizophila CBS 207.26]|uniref:Protein BFR2 n=1 Tax=Zopfia rhizophila CBS 207.26 TaxID=1314779 RepID=A0A6A6ESA6_9PEZI|nr:TRAUB-domain-containing protein [Zopfia rhizophila CBS 207.26]
MKKSKLRDFDPESLLDPAPSSSDENSDFESEEDVQAGREHYADVAKSKLRKREVVPLGPQYEGSRISREVAEDEDSDNPFARSFDAEASEEESDGPIINGNGVTGNNDESNDEEEGLFDDEEDMEGSEDESNEDMSDADQDGETEDDDDDDGDDMSEESEEEGINGSTIRKMMGEDDRKSVTATISQAAKADVEKGEAIKAQRKNFDALLNTRIRLQKALISTNSMTSLKYETAKANENAIQAAEAAALTLLNNLTNLRSTLDSARTGQKRKKPNPFTASTPSSNIWSTIQDTESSNLPHRKTILEKWSAKTRNTIISSTKGRLNTSVQQTLIDVLDSQLSDTTRLVKRTRTPRSCAPLQCAASIPESKDIYDDADFYGLLLKGLLEQRSQDAATNGGSEFVVQAPWQAAREAKTKKVVDTKASKGRKLRYTVHEKLQNFMAPEERGTWGERQRDELFGSLFGRRVGLGEEDEMERSDEEVDAEEEGLMLFRS